MMWRPCLRSRGLVTSLLLLAGSQLMAQQSDTAKSKPIFVTSSQEITPTAAPGSSLLYLNPGLTDFPNYVASGGISTAVSPEWHEDKGGLSPCTVAATMLRKNH